MHKRPRLTDGLLRPSDDDNSSSGCSSAGPSGFRNLIPSPVSTNGPRSTSGSLFSRPSPVEDQKISSNRMMSSSRYLPYTIRPLVVRAKRKLQNDNNVHVTSTAQKIINALENISTPVVNSVKIPFEPTLVSRPVFTPLRRDTQGPPILQSPLVPSPQGKIVYGPGLHIPKMVDFGTNTDLSMQSVNLEQQLALPVDTSTMRSEGGGKMKVMSSRVHAPPIKFSSRNAVPAMTPTQDRRLGYVPSKYKFSKPWTIKEVKKCLLVGEKGVDAVDNKQKSVKQESKPESMDTSKPKATKEPESATAKPLSALVQPSVTKGWDCPTCMVPNKADSPACVCCGEKNPKGPSAATSAAAPAKPPQKDWECPTCMVRNKADAAACVCCSEKNPNGPPASAGTATPAAKPAFQFGFAASTPKTSSDTFSFGPPKEASTPKSTFSFGVKSDAAPPATSASTPTSSFTFGVKPNDSSKTAADTTATTTLSSQKSFSFGTNAATPTTKAPAPSITFGLPAEPSAATAVKSSPAFSSGIKAPEAAFSPKDVSLAEKTSSPQKSVFGSFSFGSTVGTPSSKPLTNVIQEEMWSCENCPARNRISVTHCIGCAAPKAKPEAKSPPGAKKFHFEPFFGGRSDSRPSDAYSPPEGELKRKIPSNSSGSSATSLGFTYTPPTESTLKMKVPEAVPATSAAAEMKTGSFLDALKSKSQVTFAAPAPGTSLIPTSPASGSSATPSALSSSITPSVTAIPSSTSAVTAVSPAAPAQSGPPAGLFQFGAPSTSTAPGSKALATSGFGSQSLANNSLNQSSFTFGASGLKNGPLPSASSTPAPAGTTSIFGSGLPAAGGSSSSFVFGAAAASSPPAGSGPTGLGLGATSPPAAAAPAQPSAGFSFTPNFNFGSPAAAPAAAPGGAFVFTAQPSASPQAGDGGMPGRKIRKATRRIR